LAGHLRLANLCWMYDDNGITIEGRTQLAFSEDVATRFAGLGWNVVRMPDANDLLAIGAAIREFLETDDRPTLIVVRSHIAYGAPHKQDTHEAHGAPLGEEEIRLTKRGYGWPEDAKFHVPAEVPAHFQAGIGRRGAQERRAWTEKLAAYRQAHPDLARQWDLIQAKQLPAGWDAAIPVFPADVKGADVKGADVKGADVKGADVKGADAKGLATRAASGKVLNAVAQHIPWLVGGSADLSPSTNTMLLFEGAGEFQAGQSAGRNFHFGIREHGMAAALGGMALCGLRPYGGTFFVFSDYLRPAMRLAALMRLPVLYVFTHDSIGLGEDGPTHQPIEHLAACRAIPGLVVLRPGDANEVAEAYRTILSRAGGPVALVLTRQNVPTLDRTRFACAAGLARGAYVLADPPDGMPELILIGTGSELSLCVAAYETLTAEGRRVRVVSMPSWELFDVQDDAYRDAVLPPQVTARVAVEAGIGQGWQRYLGPRGRFLGLTTFGASAPAGQLFSHFGLTLENVLKAAKEF
jgi:transketolase